ncbi:MAG: redox-regulated ATPase YchF [Planctomycetaceae bacterium]|nr:redox-regulated ATPase YchF [Planctomycetaceae bacterium]
MKIGLVGYQGSGKSTVFELLTGIEPDIAKAHSGQVGVAVVPDERFDQLVELYKPKKESPSKIELFDTPGLDRDQQSNNAQRLGVIRESSALVLVVGSFAGSDAIADVDAFQDDLVLADLQVVNNRVERLKKDVTKPRPDRDDLQAELDALLPIVERLEASENLQDAEFSELQEKAVKSFALLTRKEQLIVLNTANSDVDEETVKTLEGKGYTVMSAAFGLELEVAALPEDEREIFAEEMGLSGSSREALLQAIFKVTDQITFFTSGEKEVHAWLVKRGATAIEAADAIHSDLARGFIRAEIMASGDLLRLGSEREVKAAGLNHTEGKDYIVQDGDEIEIRFNV